MPLYFFEVDDGERLTPDVEGQELDNLQAAQKEVLALLPDLARMMLHQREQWTIVSYLKDAGGKVLFRATLSLCIEHLIPTHADADSLSGGGGDSQ